jgi:hypothetical protein
VFSARRKEADQFYAMVIPPKLPPDEAMVMRQALAGLLWGKQYYEYDVHRWLREHGVSPWHPNAPVSSVRNVPWFHMFAGDIISMPDKWEYPYEMNLLEVAREIGTRLASTFTEDESGRRPVFGGIEKFQTDPHWHDLLLFHEYFHGDNGAGIGASHQTGWTGAVALLFLLGGGLHSDLGATAGLAG